jgi:hypothetical protein
MLPRRMHCEKNTQVAGTLILQESRTLHSNQLFNEEMSQKQQSFREEPFKKKVTRVVIKVDEPSSLMNIIEKRMTSENETD